MVTIVAILLDIAAVLLAVFFVVRGYRAGLVKTAVKLLGFILALVLAFLLSAPLAEGAYNLFVRDSVQQTLDEKLMAVDSKADIEEGLRETLEALPDAVTNLMENWGLGSAGELADSVSQKLAETSESASQVIEKNIISPVVTVLLRVLIFIILVILLLIAVNIVAAVLDKIFSLPVLRTLNGLGGAVLGAAQGVIAVLVLVTALQLVAGSASPDSLLSQQTLEGTYLIKHIAAANPLTGFVEAARETVQGLLEKVS